MREGAFLTISFEPQLIKVTKLGQLIDIDKGNNFHGSFKQFGGLRLGSRFFLSKQSAQITQ